MTQFKKTALAVAVASTLALAGCGGGGGSSSSSSSGGGVPQGSAQTVSGTAVKGLLKNAQVTVFELDGSGNRLRSVATATTNEQGEYEAALSAAYQGGLLEVEVAPVPGQTRMLCDASACGSVAKGEELELPEDFKLSAIVAKADGDRVSAPVTAWTTMASKRAKASADRGEDIKTAVKEAYYQVQQIVGFDPSKVAAKDVNSLAGASEEEQQAAVMNAVVAELIFKDSVDSDDYLDKFERFTSAIEEDDSFGDANDGFELLGLAVATEQALETASIDDPEVLSKLQTQSAVYEDPANQGGLTATEFDPDNVVDEDASPSEKIENFKQFVAGVRAWATSIEALDTAQLGEVVDVETVEAVFREGPIASLKLAQEIINQSLESVALEPAEISSLLEGASKTIALLDNGVEVGTAELTASDEGGLRFEVVGTVSGEAGTALLPFELAIGTSLSPESVDFNTETVKAVLADTEVVVNGQVEDGTGSALLRLNDVVARLELANAVNADSSAGYVTDEQLDDAFVGASLKGGLELYAESGESFAGSFEGRLTRLQEGHRFVFTSSPISVQKLKVGGTFTAASGETFDASVNLNVNNASEFDTFAWLDYSEETRWVEFPTDLSVTQLLDRLGGEAETDSDVVARHVGIWGTSYGEMAGEIYYDRSVADGEPVSHHLTFPLSVVQPDVDVLADVVANMVPVVTFHNNQGDSLTLSTAELFADGNLSVDYSSQEGEASGRLTVQVDGIAIGSTGDIWWAEPASLPEGGAILSSGFADGVILTLTVEGETVDGLVAAFLDEKLAIDGAQWTGIGPTYYSDWLGEEVLSVSFSRPASREYYEACLADPQAELAKLQREDGLWWMSSAQACASATLSYYWDVVSLDAAGIELVNQLAQEALVQKFGAELASEMAFDFFQVYVSDFGTNAFMADVEFPNLESEESFIDASLTVSAAARNLPDLPDAKVTVTANRNSYRGGELFANLKWNQGQYWIELASDNLDEPELVSGRFYDGYGRELVLQAHFDQSGELSDLTGDAFVNGEDIGDVTLRDRIPVITYTNGEQTEFESLF